MSFVDIMNYSEEPTLVVYKVTFIWHNESLFYNVK